jgi:hypothetical protein
LYQQFLSVVGNFSPKFFVALFTILISSLKSEPSLHSGQAKPTVKPGGKIYKLQYFLRDRYHYGLIWSIPCRSGHFRFFVHDFIFSEHLCPPYVTGGLALFIEHSSFAAPKISVVDPDPSKSETFSRIRIRKNYSGSGQLRTLNEFEIKLLTNWK